MFCLGFCLFWGDNLPGRFATRREWREWRPQQLGGSVILVVGLDPLTHPVDVCQSCFFFRGGTKHGQMIPDERVLMILMKLRWDFQRSKNLKSNLWFDREITGLDPLKVFEIGHYDSFVTGHADQICWIFSTKHTDIPMCNNNHGALEADTILCEGKWWSCGDLPFFSTEIETSDCWRQSHRRFSSV